MLRLLSISTISLAGLIHLILAPTHFAHAPAHGIFFVAAGVAEILWALAFWRKPSPRLYYAGIALIGGLVFLWLITRFFVSPFEHEPGAWDLGGLACKASELLGILTLGTLAVQGQIAGMPPSTLMRTASIAALLSLVVGGVTYGGGLAVEPLLPSLAAMDEHEQGEAAAHLEQSHSTEENAPTVGNGKIAGVLGDLEIVEPWANATPQGYTGIIFLTIRNHGQENENLLTVTSPVSRTAEIRQQVIENGAAKLVQVIGSLPIPGEGEFSFEPSGYQILLLGLKQDLRAGEHFDLTLNFDHAGSLSVEVEIRAP
jgi:hypothetical protein